MKKILGLLMISAFLFASCGDDDEPAQVICSITNFNAMVNETIGDLNSAITAFNNDNTVANCEAMKDAAQDYLDTVELFVSCEDVSSEYASQLAAAQDAVDTIIC